MNQMISAIVNDDQMHVESLLRADKDLATCLIRTPKLYSAGIFHWINVGDTLLHLAETMGEILACKT
jgi:hypothetical protein